MKTDCFVIELKNEDVLTLALEPDDVLEIEVANPVAPPMDYYEGPYTFTSALFDTQIFQTEHKCMKNNIQIKPIPIHEVSNPQGGTTVTIGN